ncbi:cysteinyl-tRNA synthetase [Dispira parvispora]|uniref:Adenylate cyclase n=1 Tax=Dispira parvispora TaxID=1520584 RepID=A0A9W8E8F3_9FUNG|nr:cysteinyl-tRNA synthetase [Dispira parvispora]
MDRTSSHSTYYKNAPLPVVPPTNTRAAMSNDRPLQQPSQRRPTNGSLSGSPGGSSLNAMPAGSPEHAAMVPSGPGLSVPPNYQGGRPAYPMRPGYYPAPSRYPPRSSQESGRRDYPPSGYRPSHPQPQVLLQPPQQHGHLPRRSNEMVNPGGPYRVNPQASPGRRVRPPPLPTSQSLANYSVNSGHLQVYSPRPRMASTAPHSPTKEKKKGFNLFKRKKHRYKEREAEGAGPPPGTPGYREQRSGSDGGTAAWGLGHFVSSITRPHHDKSLDSGGYDLHLDTNVNDMEGIVNMEQAASLRGDGASIAPSQSRRGSHPPNPSEDLAFGQPPPPPSSQRPHVLPGANGVGPGVTHPMATPLGHGDQLVPPGSVSHPSASTAYPPDTMGYPPRKDQPMDPFHPMANLGRVGTQADLLEGSPEAWAPPDSWAVLPDSVNGPTDKQRDQVPSEEDDNIENDGMTYYLRIYRPDSTFCTVACRLNSTSTELIRMAAKKFYMEDTSKYCLYVKKANSLERTVGANEKPVWLMRTYLEQMGYTREDNLSAHMREDNTYLCQFTLIEAALPSMSANIDQAVSSPKHIDLRGFRLQTIPVSLYYEPAKILYLNLSKNLKVDFPSDFAQLCTNLRELRLATCQYRRVPMGVRFLQNLLLLDLSGNELRNLNNAHLEDLRNLQDLLVRNNRLESLAPEFTQFRNLRRLTLSNNNFNDFPTAVCEIRTLVELDLSFNFIAHIPDSIGQLTKLKILSLLCNRLTGALPQTFQNLTQLGSLDLRRNTIQDVSVLSQLPHLRKLFCDHNSLSTLHGDFQALKDLSLGKSYLTSFSLRDAAHSLTHLKLSHCQLSELPAELFTYLPALERVEIDNNHLTTLPRSVGQLQRLRYLSSTNNKLKTLPTDLALLPNLEILDVHSNDIKSLFPEIWLAPKLKILNVSSNLLEAFPHPSQAERSLSASTAATGKTDEASLYGYRKHSLDETIQSSKSTGRQLDRTARTQSRSKSTFLHEEDLQAAMKEAQEAGQENNGGVSNDHGAMEPPLSGTLLDLRMGGNYLTEEVFNVLAYLGGLRILNLSFNEQIYEVPPGAFCNNGNLTELYLSGTQISTLPGEDMDRLRSLRVLHVNANKLQTLPAELGKISKLAILDAGSNMLRYNISNWTYDWNWNWNLDLRYLNLSNNKRLEINRSHNEVTAMHNRDLAGFTALTNLRVLGLMDITMMVSPPDQTPSRRIRTSASMVDSIHYGMADKLGPEENLTLWDCVVPRFRGAVDECLFGLFDSRTSGSAGGSKLFSYMNEGLTEVLKTEVDKLGPQETPVSALRRTFLTLNKQLGGLNIDSDHRLGAGALVAYFVNTTVYIANVGNILAVVSRNGAAKLLATKHTPANPSEVRRIRSIGGYISQQGLVQGELEVTRSFGYFHLLPFVNANPSIEQMEVSEEDEFIIIASRGLWEHLSYQTAVDVARRIERHDANLAAQKLRDYAISYGADKSLMVMVLGLRELFGRNSNLRNRHLRSKALPANWGKFSLGDYKDDLPLARMRRGAKDELPADSTLARLDREVEPPTGEVALVFTDIKNSTFLWETMPVAMRSAIWVHNVIMRRLLRTIGGYEVKTEGDAFMVSFPTVAAALHWALAVQLQLLQADWPQEILDCHDGREIYSPTDPNQLIYRGLWVRMGIHWGSPVCEEDPITRRMDYFGPMVNRSARICSAADGGQIFVSQDVVNEIMAIKEMLDSDVNFIATPKPSGNEQGSHSSSAASATSIAALVATAAHNGSSISLEQLSKDIQALKKLGLSIVHIGERRLKGLETPESLASAYPKDLSGRLEFERLKAEVANQAPLPDGVPAASITPPSVTGEGVVPPLSTPNLAPVQGGETSTLSPPEAAGPAVRTRLDSEPRRLTERADLTRASPSMGPRIIVRPPGAAIDSDGKRSSLSSIPYLPISRNRSLSNYQIAGSPAVQSMTTVSHSFITREGLWHLEQICYRLERLSTILVNRSHGPLPPFRYGPVSMVNETELVPAAERLVARIDNASRSLLMLQMERTLDALADAPVVFTKEPGYLQAALALFMNMVQADPTKYVHDLQPGETLQVVEEPADGYESDTSAELLVSSSEEDENDDDDFFSTRESGQSDSNTLSSQEL